MVYDEACVPDQDPGIHFENAPPPTWSQAGLPPDPPTVPRVPGAFPSFDPAGFDQTMIAVMNGIVLPPRAVTP